MASVGIPGTSVFAGFHYSPTCRRVLGCTCCNSSGTDAVPQLRMRSLPGVLPRAAGLGVVRVLRHCCSHASETPVKFMAIHGNQCKITPYTFMPFLQAHHHAVLVK